MNKYQNAIGIIKACGLNIKGSAELQEEAKRVESTIIDALEKQIPKKPKRRKDTTYTFCPCCDSGNLQNDYCTDCGQKIDWSDTE